MRAIDWQRKALLAALVVAGLRPATSFGEPVRGAYFYSSLPRTHLDALAGAGFTCGLVKFPALAITPAIAADAERMRAHADSLGLDLFITLNFHNPRLVSERATPERRFRDSRGISYPDVPCPADTAYWCGLLEEMVLPMARIPGRPPRIALDLELYDVPISHYPPGPCTCTPCRLEYTGYTGPNRALAEPWIDEMPLRDFEDLERAERGWVETLLADELYAMARTTGPIALAVLDLGRQGLPNHALLGACDRLDIEVLDFTELTYARGAAVPSEELHGAYADQREGVRTIAGLWLQKWTPLDLEGEAERLGRRESGYWIFTSSSLALPASSLFGPYTLQAPAAEYWQALARANGRLAGAD